MHGVVASSQGLASLAQIALSLQLPLREEKLLETGLSPCLPLHPPPDRASSLQFPAPCNQVDPTLPAGY